MHSVTGAWRICAPDVADMSRWVGLEGARSIEDLLADLHRDAQRVPRILVSIVKAIAAKSAR